MFIELINNKTGGLFNVNTNHIVSVWSGQDNTGWEITYCVDTLGDIYKMISIKSILQKQTF